MCKRDGDKEGVINTPTQLLPTSLCNHTYYLTERHRGNDKKDIPAFIIHFTWDIAYNLLFLASTQQLAKHPEHRPLVSTRLYTPIAMALTRDPKDALLFVLCDLEEESFKTLKFYLQSITLPDGHWQLARGKLKGLSPVDLASQLIDIYGANEAVNVVLKGLKKMNLLELVDHLSHVCLNDYRERYREHVRYLEERQEGGVNGSYNQLLLVAKSSSGCPEKEVTVNDLFGSGERSSKSTVVLQGSAGTGKTTLARKIVLDWASGTLFAGQFDYVFYVSCREVVLLPECTLDLLLFWCCGDNKAPVKEILRQPERLLFILDGFDELQRPFAEKLMRPRLSPMQDLLHRLIRRNILSESFLFITTRPLALQNLGCLLQQPHHVHIVGFSEEERKRYFRFYFTDEEQARNALDFVQRNQVLYKACQVPGICWVVCSWLKKQLERGKEISDIPSNSTDIYMAYVSTFLPPNDNEDCLELPRHKVLKSLCSLAAEGIQHQKILFEEADLKKYNLDGPKLAAFLSSSDYQEGLDVKKFYSFRHISFQEFFYAMSYLVKEDHHPLGKESRRELERLLETKNEDMTLSMQFLLDMLKYGSSSNLEVKFCFKISSYVIQDLKHFKKQLESVRHNSTWDLEFSLYESKIKNLVKGIQWSDTSVALTCSNEKEVRQRCSFNVKTSLRNRQGKEPKNLLEDKNKRAGTQKGDSDGKGRGTKEPETRKLGAVACGSIEMGTIEVMGQRNGGVQEQENWSKTAKKNGKM
ncbi:PREDICTED: NACHT, LRR and PYD domains-containing protein 10 [Chrysochloris asiatica]|uniref:NACHT, LRR and PYD domains-containing protein 10 n=1 Tax=Chrysochloris asiatica TaxID=185453 RepID=A0A9B0U5P5_CHRAS|nr:PREDICTED: NACHT, LRR and PYD domains-containing protein 10 [Chrysochloris asiatica]